ncbi:MAG: hypothetical protein K0U78_19775 [Actinomycetia bacterium]|nr:hypothetical protein [Actinomycetes bacterium]
MAEVRLGSNENMKNINLGSIEIQEVYLGNILVWQNNQAPIYLSLSWDGTSFVVPTPFEALTGTASSDVAGGGSNITITIGGLSDPDNIDPLTDDFLVGYRLQRPDGTYAAGDPASVANRADGAPVAEFGDALPGTSSTWDAVEEEFTAGSETLGTSNITAALRETDSDGNIVDSLTQEFVDDGNWILIVVDSRGGESEMATMDITLTYEDPSGTVRGDSTTLSTNSASPTLFTNPDISVTTDIITVDALLGGGPLTETVADRYTWTVSGGGSTVTGTGSTIDFNLASISAPSGSATVTVTGSLLGRSYPGNEATPVNIGPAYFRALASFTGPSVGGDGTYTCNATCTGATINFTYGTPASDASIAASLVPVATTANSVTSSVSNPITVTCGVAATFTATTSTTYTVTQSGVNIFTQTSTGSRTITPTPSAIGVGCPVSGAPAGTDAPGSMSGSVGPFACGVSLPPSAWSFSTSVTVNATSGGGVYYVNGSGCPIRNGPSQTLTCSGAAGTVTGGGVSGTWAGPTLSISGSATAPTFGCIPAGGAFRVCTAGDDGTNCNAGSSPISAITSGKLPTCSTTAQLSWSCTFDSDTAGGTVTRSITGDGNMVFAGGGSPSDLVFGVGGESGSCTWTIRDFFLGHVLGSGGGSVSC